MEDVNQRKELLQGSLGAIVFEKKHKINQECIFNRTCRN